MTTFQSLMTYGALALCFTGTAGAALYSQDFESDATASWTVNDPGLSDVTADFFYDYSTIGVPSAPNGTGTRGMKLTANNSGGVFSGFSVSPTGQSFAGDYEVRFDLWSNYVGPLGVGGSGSTQLSTYGIGTSGTTAFWPGAAVKESVAFANTLDGGSASDYRAYSSAAPTSYAGGNPVYAAPGGAINESNSYYTAAFPSVIAPASQVGLFPGQTGSTDPGETAFRWVDVRLTKTGDTVTWRMDGLLIATIDLTTVTLGGGNILFGHSDTNAGSSTDPKDGLLNVTLIDNIQVIPEPSGSLLSFLGAAVLFRRRR
jgi:hypothetical protein